MGLWIVSEGKAINYGTSAASLLFTGSSHQNCCLSSRLLSCPAFVDVVRPNQFSFAVFAGETAAVPKDCSSEQISFSDSVSVPDEPMMDGGEKDEEESFDSHKMIRDRADSEDDLGMKHKFLWLGRKLKEWFGGVCGVQIDVQRHNELLEAVKALPSEINEIISRQRKNFTEEFFVHLHTIA
ncbi:hypothetical protein SLEP1_g2045 [Rubroshorea leprosula]|uniref:Uncharacterized protein n=1 Tax=Rubroshorea leprosula TaxID=152421 RepID=A0AAV5HR68_9ROSI|nr:hypothetical protein SLEP1_g2045 [Rubroshorea leprosula]